MSYTQVVTADERRAAIIVLKDITEHMRSENVKILPREIGREDDQMYIVYGEQNNYFTYARNVRERFLLTIFR